jgi:hypothetical protein
MLADPRDSRVVLINLTRGGRLATGDPAARHLSLSLLQAGLDVFAVASTVVGHAEPFGGQGAGQRVCSITQLGVDALSIWDDPRFTDSLTSPETGIIFVGGSWLEEDIFIAAVQAAEQGYDVRVLSDLVAARVETDRLLVFDRLALHGILPTTVRQTLVEWAVCLADPALKRTVRQLLS